MIQFANTELANRLQAVDGVGFEVMLRTREQRIQPVQLLLNAKAYDQSTIGV